jgi:hypothetical protein
VSGKLIKLASHRVSGNVSSMRATHRGLHVSELGIGAVGQLRHLLARGLEVLRGSCGSGETVRVPASLPTLTLLKA